MPFGSTKTMSAWFTPACGCADATSETFTATAAWSSAIALLSRTPVSGARGRVSAVSVGLGLGLAVSVAAAVGAA